jgi:hypothetical protein
MDEDRFGERREKFTHRLQFTIAHWRVLVIHHRNMPDFETRIRIGFEPPSG